MNLLEKNIEVLSQNSAHMIAVPKADKLAEAIFEVDELGNTILILEDCGHILKSEFDSSNNNLPNPLKRELIFVFGIYAVEEIKELLEKVGKESLVVIIEPNSAIFNYTLQSKDLSFLRTSSSILIVDEISEISRHLEKYLSSMAVFYLKTIKFYFTHFYRESDIKSSVNLIKVIKQVVQYKTMIYGNSVEDSLIGFRHHMKNLKHLPRSKDVSLLKDSMVNVPAIVVSAGPSLNKNIDELKGIYNKVIIIAVDTIAQRLCDEGIIPDFICSIERGIETYKYFYEGKTYPVNSTLVAPLVLYPDVFNEFTGDIIVPMRGGVGEFDWLKRILNLKSDNSIGIGLSCAHVAFGIANHLGASPIALIGQDLAYGSSVEESHAIGTIYDDKEVINATVSPDQILETEGYYGGLVKTTQTWNTFRTWFEVVTANDKLHVINATEGGARIANTEQMSLHDFGEKYCVNRIKSMPEVLKEINNYPIEKSQIKRAMEEQYEYFSKVKERFESQRRQVSRIKNNKRSTSKELQKSLNIIDQTENFFKLVLDNQLLRHCLQPAMINSIWNLYDIERVINADNVTKAQKINLGFLDISLYTLKEITTLLDETVRSLVEES